MEKIIYINNEKTNFSIDEIGRLKNINNQHYLKGAINKGYHFYNIYFRGRQYTLYTHKLVATYFIDNPNGYTFVHHIDGNKLNNLVSNLQWIACEEHQKTIDFNGLGTGKHEIFDEQNIDKKNIAQFRNSPYYATKDGHVLNMIKHIQLKEEKTGDYKRVQCNYSLNGKHFLCIVLYGKALKGKFQKGMKLIILMEIQKIIV